MNAARTAKVSVCLPVFDGKRYLAQAIESVLNQTHTNFELLISDDGSRDGSWEIIQDYAQRDSRIVAWQAAQRAGIFGNYNRCIERASGDYIKFLAQDDLLSPEHLGETVGILESHSTVVVVATRRNWIDAYGNDVGAIVSTPSSSDVLPVQTCLSGKQVVSKCLLPPVNYIGEPATVTIRRKSAGTGFDPSYYQMGDLDYWARILLTGDYYFIDKPLTSFRVHDQSQTTRNTRALLFAPDFLRLVRKFEVEMERLGIQRERLLRESLQAVAIHIKFLLETSDLAQSDLGYSDLRNQYEQFIGGTSHLDGQTLNRLICDLQAFRELSVHALNELNGRSEPTSDYVRTELDWHTRKRMISTLEHTLRVLLSSQSWRLTRVLRELAPGRSPISPATEAKTKHDNPLPGAESYADCESYVVHLHQQIARVKNSRSWKLTELMRLLGILDGQLNRADADVGTAYASKLFDSQFYLTTNPDIHSVYAEDPLVHYFFRGAVERRDPHPLFDTRFYLSQLGRQATNIDNALEHYLIEGAADGLDPHLLFDTAYYLTQNPDLSKTSFNPLMHYLEYGSKELLDPHPLFDTSFYVEQMRARGVAGINPLVHYVTRGYREGFEPSFTFHASAYLSRYPDVQDAGMNPLWHYLRYGLAEDRVARRFRTIAESAAAEHPTVHATADSNSAVAITASATVRATRRRRDQVAAAMKVIKGEIAGAPVTHVVVTGVLTRGGAERSACAYARAIAERIGADKVLLVITDRAKVTCRDWLPPGIRVVNLMETDPTLTGEARAILLLNLLSACSPTTVIGFNSLTFWNMVDCHVPSWRNELSCRFVGYLGGYETFTKMNDWGYINGPMRRVARLFDLFITENPRMRDTMIEQYADVSGIRQKVICCLKSLTPELAAALALPSFPPHQASDPTQVVASAKGKACRVLWAARLDRIKRPDVLAQIAELMPDVQFDVFGCESPGTDITQLRMQPNVMLRGEFADFSAVPTADTTLFLHTSEADGMPNILLEAAARGLPIVAANVGGISGFVNDRTGWLVDGYDNAAAYVKMIRHVIENPDTARARAAVARKLVADRHQWSEFCNRVGALDIWQTRDQTAPCTKPAPAFSKLAKVSFLF